MYIPRFNEETRVPVLRALMREHSLAALITMGEGGLTASHIPMVLEDDGTEFGVLKGHLSRANTQWKTASKDIEALAIFSGTQQYISPSWYAAKQEHGKVVPTWNYVVVHAYGKLKLIEDPRWLIDHLVSLTNTHEAGFPTPWKVTDAPPDFITSQMKGIIGLEFPIRKLEGKWKISQNKNQADRDGILKGLDALHTADSEVMKTLIEKLDSPKGEPS